MNQFDRDLRFLLLQWTSIVAAKIFNLKFQKKNLAEIDFFYLTDYLSLTFLYMWVKYELIWSKFNAQNENFGFSEIFPKEQRAWLDVVQIRATLL